MEPKTVGQPNDPQIKKTYKSYTINNLYLKLYYIINSQYFLKINYKNARMSIIYNNTTFYTN